MRIAYITAGAAGRYCGNCLQDNVLALALRELGEDILLLPTYTPIRTDIVDASEKRLFFNGIRVYLEQRYQFFRRPRPILDRFLGSRALIGGVTQFFSSTDPAGLGDITLSMLEGEEGRQQKELEELVDWLQRDGRPDIVHLSNVLLVGMARRLKEALKVPVICGLQAEDSFLDLLPGDYRNAALERIAARGSEVDEFVSVSEYYADHAAKMFGLSRDRITVVLPGVYLAGHGPVEYRREPELTIGYLARIAPEKGIHLLCDAFARLAVEERFSGLRLKVAGFLAGEQVAFASRLRKRLTVEGLGSRVEFIGTVGRAEKLAFLQGIDVLAVPTVYPDPKGLFVLEALASGVPVVSPRHGVFPELLDATGGGVLCEPDDVDSLTGVLREVLLDRELRVQLGTAGRETVLERFGAERMARETLAVYRAAVEQCAGANSLCGESDDR